MVALKCFTSGVSLRQCIRYASNSNSADQSFSLVGAVTKPAALRLCLRLPLTILKSMDNVTALADLKVERVVFAHSRVQLPNKIVLWGSTVEQRRLGMSARLRSSWEVPKWSSTQVKTSSQGHSLKMTTSRCGDQVSDGSIHKRLRIRLAAAREIFVDSPRRPALVCRARETELLLPYISLSWQMQSQTSEPTILCA